MSCSPQRKRRTSADLELTDDPTSSPRASDSPRTAVARRFGALDLHDLHDSHSANTSDDSQTPRKRRQKDIISPERMRLPRSPPVSPAGPATVQGLGLSLGPAAPLTPSSSPAKRVVVASPSPQRETSPGRRGKGRRRLRSPSPRIAGDNGEGGYLTWQPGEITGYTIDSTVPDDSDGLGINGLGFVPSPAEAERRRDRRRKQVLEWRAREARDERRRRVERRSGGKVRDVDQGEASRRVRFGVVAGD